MVTPNGPHRSLGYTLIQLRPSPEVGEKRPRAVVGECNQASSPPQTTSTRRPLSRWLTVYLPVALAVAGLLYILCELAMKHLAVRTLHRQLLALPERPTQPPPLDVFARPPPRRPPTASSLHSHPVVEGLRPMVFQTKGPQLASFPYATSEVSAQPMY